MNASTMILVAILVFAHYSHDVVFYGNQSLCGLDSSEFHFEPSPPFETGRSVAITSAGSKSPGDGGEVVEDAAVLIAAELLAVAADGGEGDERPAGRVASARQQRRVRLQEVQQVQRPR